MKRQAKKMTPKEFKERMRMISLEPDTERAHSEADDLLCQLLCELGYRDGIELFKAMTKWYA